VQQGWDGADTSTLGRGRPFVEIEGIRFDALTEQQTIDLVLEASSRGCGGTVITPNVDIVRQLTRPSNRALAHAADLVLCDGMPLLWCSRILGRPIPERVTGSSLITTLSLAVLRRGGAVVLIGGQPGSALKAARVLTRSAQRESSAVRALSPPIGFEHVRAEMNRIHRLLAEAKPAVVFIGLGFPKQEKLAEQLRQDYPHCWFIGCGGSIAMLSGEVARAPVWVRRMGFEWLFRFLQEPTRLFRRYFVLDMPYAFGLLMRAAQTRLNLSKPADL
jgi:N-acetylglucosaminyldiphosphoundecaprenol N-acetyl-beta-D-mannosaminyltransferase